MKIKCITNKRTVNVEGKRYSFSYGDIKELPRTAGSSCIGNLLGKVKLPEHAISGCLKKISELKLRG